MEGNFLQVGRPSDLIEANKRLTEEVAQCNADKEFVWSLWRQLQKESPDIVATVDMVITREKLQHEKQEKEAGVLLQTKDAEIATLKSLLETCKVELSDLRSSVNSSETEVAILKTKMQEECSERERQALSASKVLAENEALQNRRNELERLVKELQLSKKSLIADNLTKHASIDSLRKEMADLNSRAEMLLSNLTSKAGECSKFEAQLQENRQLLHEKNSENLAKDTEIIQLRTKLKELSSSRDTWAHHTSLQSTTIHRLQSENSKLEADVREKEEKIKAHSEGVMRQRKPLKHLSPYAVMKVSTPVSYGKTTSKHVDNDVKLSKLLEKTEKQLFETKSLLEAKSKELEGIRCSHDRRLHRMQSLQATHKLVLEQLKTYEAKESIK